MGQTPGSRPTPRKLGNQRDSLGRMVEEVPTTMAPGAGILAGTGTIYRASVVREGDIIVTRILMDLTGLSSTTTDLDIIGTAGVSHIGQITTAVNGVILGGTMTCFEVPAGGADDIDLYAAVEGTGAYDGAVTDLTSDAAVITAGGAWSLGEVQTFTADAIAANDYLYLTSGEAGTAAAYTAGRFLITMFGNPV